VGARRLFANEIVCPQLNTHDERFGDNALGDNALKDDLSKIQGQRNVTASFLIFSALRRLDP